jgi:hypothetical protein
MSGTVLPVGVWACGRVGWLAPSCLGCAGKSRFLCGRASAFVSSPLLAGNCVKHIRTAVD